MFALRPALSSDQATLADICIRTGDAGQDATRLYAEPQLLADIYVLPYLALEPRWCWVVEDDGGVAGYLVGAPDTRAFARRAEAQWWPALRHRHPLPAVQSADPQAHLVRRLHAGVPVEPALVDSHPAHLHIDILPRAQGRGLGRRLMATFMQELQVEGVPGVHLGVASGNAGAIAFYRREGFVVLQDHRAALWMGRRTLTA